MSILQPTSTVSNVQLHVFSSCAVDSSCIVSTNEYPPRFRDHCNHQPSLFRVALLIPVRG